MNTIPQRCWLISVDYVRHTTLWSVCIFLFNSHMQFRHNDIIVIYCIVDIPCDKQQLSSQFAPTDSCRNVQADNDSFFMSTSCPSCPVNSISSSSRKCIEKATISGINTAIRTHQESLFLKFLPWVFEVFADCFPCSTAWCRSEHWPLIKKEHCQSFG